MRALAGCVGQLDDYGHDLKSFWSSSPGLGRRQRSVTPEAGTEEQSLACESIACLFDGRLDNRQELVRSLGDHPLAAVKSSDVNLVLAAYDRFGAKFLDFLKGDFVLAVFDRKRKRLLLARDPVGIRSLSYTRVGDQFLFASGVKTLLAYPGVQCIPDEAMVAEFFLYFPSSDSQKRTFFRGIHSLPPGYMAVVDEHGVQLHQYSDFETRRTLRLRSVRDYAEAFHSLFTNSVRRRIRSQSPVAITVSGGLDSSYIFCVARRLWREEADLCPAVIGFNYGGPVGTDSDESIYVRGIERASGAQIERLKQVRGLIAAGRHDVRYCGSPQIDCVGNLSHAVRRSARETGAQVLIGGNWGDQLLDDSDYLLDLIRGGKWRLLARHTRNWRVGAKELAPLLFRDAVERVAPRFITSLLPHLRGRFDGPWKAPWFTHSFRRTLFERFTSERLQRVRGTTHSWAIYKQIHLSYQVYCREWIFRAAESHGVDYAFPYLDHDLVQFLMSIPGEIQSYEGVSRGLMREAMRGTVPDAIVDRRDKGDFTKVLNESVEGDFPEIRNLLGPGALTVEFGYLDGPVLWKILDEWETEIRHTQNALLASGIGRLCGLELFLRCFFSASKTHFEPDVHVL